MRHHHLLLLCCIVLAGMIIGYAGPAPAEPDLVLSGAVIRVVDGDTVDVRLSSGPVRVRLYGIDTPERTQPFGMASAAYLATMIKGQQVQLLPVAQDAYDRIVGVLYLGDVNVDAELVRTGHAWAFRRYLGALADDAAYCRLEGRARDSGSGLWSLPAGDRVPPWEYRAARRPGRHVSADYSNETVEKCIAAMAGGRPADQAKAATSTTSRPGCLIKGNINSRGERIYHSPGLPSYAATRINEAAGERWFCSEREARLAGWRSPR